MNNDILIILLYFKNIIRGNLNFYVFYILLFHYTQ